MQFFLSLRVFGCVYVYFIRFARVLKLLCIGVLSIPATKPSILFVTINNFFLITYVIYVIKFNFCS